jgi:hypothetical protein
MVGGERFCRSLAVGMKQEALATETDV